MTANLIVLALSFGASAAWWYWVRPWIEKRNIREKPDAKFAQDVADLQVILQKFDGPAPARDHVAERSSADADIAEARMKILE